MGRRGTINLMTPSTWREALMHSHTDVSSKAASQVMSGSIIMLAGSTLVSGVNFLYNVAMARMLGPERFGQVTAAVTILMLFSAVTLSFQLVCAKFVARNHSSFGRKRVYQTLLRKSWSIGLSLGVTVAVFSRQIAAYLNLPSAWIIVLLSAGLMIYVPLGVRRGRLQGMFLFPKLTWNFILEAVVKLLLAVLLVALGYGVMGAVGALAASVLCAFLFVIKAPADAASEDRSYQRASFREGMQAIVFFVGQVVINNIDILMVKHFFPDGPQAGIYAAVALVGRVLYFACWSVVSAMFPVSAAAEQEGSAWEVLRWPLLVVGGMSLMAVGVMAAFPQPIMHLVFGETFHATGNLLALYAGLTGIYALAVTLITFEMSRKIANTGWLQLVFSAMVVIGIAMFHQTLAQVALVQLALMLALLAAVSLPFVRDHLRASGSAGKVAGEAAGAVASVKTLRRIPEQEVIAAFLQAEFYQSEFDRDRADYAEMVLKPDLGNRKENAIRRALLFRRRGHMWRELPHDIAWEEVQLEPEDLGKIRVFPRAHWRRLSGGNFRLDSVVENIRRNPSLEKTDAVIAKIHLMRSRLKRERLDPPIILIGVDEQQPLTILEGNHRFAAAYLRDPANAHNTYRVVCGFSPRMGECCWYRTNAANLWRYLRNRVKNLYDREANLKAVLKRMAPEEKIEVPAQLAATAGARNLEGK